MRYGMLIDLDRCIGCTACVVACKSENGTARDVHWTKILSRETGYYPNSKIKIIPIVCMHCQNAPCIQACPTGASYRTEEGIVLIDIDKCLGCRACVNACPYDAREYNYTDPKKSPYFEEMGLTPFEKVKNLSHQLGKAEKCTLCNHRLREKELPACVKTCVTQARIFGDLDDPMGLLAKAIRDKNAYRFNEHLGTEPSVYFSGDF